MSAPAATDLDRVGPLVWTDGISMDERYSDRASLAMLEYLMYLSTAIMYGRRFNDLRLLE